MRSISLAYMAALAAVLAMSASDITATNAQSPSLKSFGRSAPYGVGQDRSQAPEDGSGEGSASSSGQSGAGMAYRTLCVRTCDGYYWPQSASVDRGHFTRDAQACETSCDAEARLYYLPRESNDIAQMTDLSGRSYQNLRTAFAYRKALAPGCACRPMPWSVAEAVRHDSYAAVEAMQQAETEATIPAPAVAENAAGPGTTAVTPTENPEPDNSTQLPAVPLRHNRTSALIPERRSLPIRHGPPPRGLFAW